MKRTCSAFTLIELLIVVAIIGILAAIAVPQFQAAMVRAKIARVKSDLRMIMLANEAYHIDHGRYVSQVANAGNPLAYLALTTPVSYLPSGTNWNDPFYDCEYPSCPYLYHETLFMDNKTGCGKFFDTTVIVSAGPDKNHQWLIFSVEWLVIGKFSNAIEALSYEMPSSSQTPGGSSVYSSTNGLRSLGDIGRASINSLGLPPQIGG